jgi:hypothetical protein
VITPERKEERWKSKNKKPAKSGIFSAPDSGVDLMCPAGGAALQNPKKRKERKRTENAQK